MKCRKDDISNYLGRALFIVLFFLSIAAFSDRSAKQSSDTDQYELVSEWQSDCAQAVSIQAVQLPDFQKKLASSVDKMSYQLFNATFSRYADNRKITQQIISLHQIELVIKPLVICRFYYHLFPITTEELPILS